MTLRWIKEIMWPEIIDDQYQPLKYSDDEPRDDHGRWTDGGNAHEIYQKLTPDSATNTVPVSSLFRNEAIPRDLAKAATGVHVQVAGHIDYGGEGSAFGVFNENNNTITLRSGLSKEDFDYTMQHELGHARQLRDGLFAKLSSDELERENMRWLSERGIEPPKHFIDAPPRG